MERTRADDVQAGRYVVCFTRSMETFMMSLVRLLGFTTLNCGCVVGRYRELATSREVTYVEEKGRSCETQSHRRNHTVAPLRASGFSSQMSASNAS
jgi:hypothetical protein